MTKKRLFLALAAGLILVLLCIGVSFAADDPLKVSMEMSENTFTEGKPITVAITVTNAGDTDMPGPVTLYYPSGKQVEEFGAPVLEAGAGKNWTGTWTVTPSQLEAGKMTFSIRYSLYDDNGELISKKLSFSRRITYAGAEPSVSVNRTILPAIAQKGQEVVVNYEIANTGNVEITDITVKENSSVASKAETIESIAPGEKASCSFTVEMGKKDLTSAATISYKAAGKSQKETVEAAVIKYGVINLTGTLSADKKGGAPGDSLKLSLKLKNSGKKDYTDVTASDASLGVLFSGETVPAGKTVTLEKDITITETQDIQLVVNAVDADGNALETATGKVHVIATDPTQQIILSVNAEADRDTVYTIPGNVRFQVTVTNESTVPVSNIVVKAVDMTLYTFPEIEAGQSKSFIRDVQISMEGRYQFTASTKDPLGQTVSFPGNIIPIAYAQPTPEPTEVPIVTPPAPVIENVPTDVEIPEWMLQVYQISGKAKYVFGGIAGALVILLLIGAIRRWAKKRHSAAAVDQLERGSYRDYSLQVKPKQRSEIDDRLDTPSRVSGEGDTPEETTAQDSELMTETLRRLYENKPAPEEAPAVNTEPETPAAEETAENEPEKPEEKKQVEETDATSFSHRRRHK